MAEEINRDESPHEHGILRVLRNNKNWAREIHILHPELFEKTSQGQSPDFLWIGCADSRVPANEITGLRPGELFVHRNVGNLAQHTDMSCMCALEYAVLELKVKNIIVCGHYGCGAVKGALVMPSKTLSTVNCWISSIRDIRNQYAPELETLSPEEQHDRLCELNVMRQCFNVCTSPTVQAAWDLGQELWVHGFIYRLKDGILQPVVGPIHSRAEAESAAARGMQKRERPYAELPTAANGNPFSFSFVTPSLDEVIGSAIHNPEAKPLGVADSQHAHMGCGACKHCDESAEVERSTSKLGCLEADLKAALAVHARYEAAAAM